MDRSPWWQKLATVPLLLLALGVVPAIAVLGRQLGDDAPVNAWLSSVVCAQGWTIRHQYPGGHAGSRPRPRYYCVAPDGAQRSDASLAVLTLELLPMPIAAGAVFGLMYLWQPTVSARMRQLGVARAMGAISEADYHALREQIVANPHMTAARLEYILRRARGQSQR